MVKLIRGNDYHMKRLEAEHPSIFADWKAGKYDSRRQALIAAGLRRPQKPLNALKSAWKKASESEQAEFRRWIGAATGPSSSSASASSPTARPPRSTRIGPLVGPGQKLLPTVRTRIETIMHRRKLKQGDVMKEMGYTNVRDASLGMALSDSRPSAVHEDLQRNLETWLKRNKAI